MDSRQQFEEKYPLPEGMYFDNEQNAYAGTKDFWLWCTRWEAWQESRAAIIIEMPTTCASDDPYQIKREIIDELHDNGIRTK